MSTSFNAALGLLLTSTALAGQVTIAPSKDNTLYQSTTGNLSNGAGDYLFAGKTAGASIRRALLQFNVRGSVPAGAVVTDAQLFLNVSRFSGGAHPVKLQALTKDWGEGTSNAAANEGRGVTATTNDATWTKSFFGNPGVLWGTPGGDFETVPDCQASFAGLFGVLGFSSIEMVDRVQLWLDHSEENHGWIIIGEEVSSSNAIRFDSRENPTEVNRPRLKVFYSCRADFDGNNTVDQFDYLDFVQAFAENAPTADFNHDQVIDFFDYLDFLSAFARGC